MTLHAGTGSRALGGRPSDVTHWLETFAQAFLTAVPGSDRPAFLAEVRARIEPRLKTPEGTWIADYTRLRTAATRRQEPLE